MHGAYVLDISLRILFYKLVKYNLFYLLPCGSVRDMCQGHNIMAGIVYIACII